MSNIKNIEYLHDLNLIDFIQEGIVVIDKNHTIIKMNKWIENKFDTIDSLIGQKCYKVFPDRSEECPDCIAKKVFETAQVQRELIHDPFKENEDVYYEIISHPVFDNDNNAIQAILIYRDISQHTKIKFSLQETEEKYNALYKNSPLAYQSLNETGHIIDVNPNWLKLLGYSFNEVIGQWFGDFLFPEYKAAFAKNFSIFKKQGYIKDVMFRMKTKDNSELYVLFEGCIGYMTDGKFKQTYCTFKNITKQIYAEQALKERNYQLNQANEKLILVNKQAKDNEEKLTNLIANLQGVAYQCVYDKDWTMIFISQGVYELSGYDMLEIVDNNIISWNEIIHNDYREAVNKKVKEAIGNRESFTLEYKITCKNTKEKWVWEKGSAIFDNNNKLKYLEGFITDITPLKTIEEDLIAAKEKAEESSKLKTEFLNNMSHEIRTPMNGILGFSELLSHNNLNEEKRLKYFNVVQNSSDKLIKIIDDILEISNLETIKIDVTEEHINLNHFIKELVLSFTITNNISVRLNITVDDNDAEVYTDRSKLEKILSNLIDNAIKFTEEGYVKIGYVFEDDYIIFSVKDTGIGILPENKEIIFRRFSQENKEMSRKYGGLGLGLSIAKKNAKLLGGEITFESEKNIGSTFYARIPLKIKN